MNSIVTIDCDYTGPEIACAYLVKNQENSYFVENNTALAVPKLVEAMRQNAIKPEQIRYIIITHVHLDHAGGTAELLKHCPNATVLAHPRAARHLVNPTKLVESAKTVYGEEAFRKMYGTIEAVSEARVVSPEDMSVVKCGDHTLQFIYTKGHANHHFVIYDQHEQTVFTGDSFGIVYPALQHGRYPFIFPSSSPTDFDADEARASIDKIVTCGAKYAALTHFGMIDYLGAARSILLDALNSYDAIIDELLRESQPPENFFELTLPLMREYFRFSCEKRSIEFDQVKQHLDLDINLNAQGLAIAARRILKNRGQL